MNLFKNFFGTLWKVLNGDAEFILDDRQNF